MLWRKPWATSAGLRTAAGVTLLHRHGNADDQNSPGEQAGGAQRCFHMAAGLRVLKLVAGNGCACHSHMSPSELETSFPEVPGFS